MPVWLPGAGWFGRHLEVGDQAEVVGGAHVCGWLIKGEKAVRHLQGRAVDPAPHHNSTMAPDPDRAKNVYVREDKLLPHLPALHLHLAGEDAAARTRRRTRRGTDVRPGASPEEVLGYLRQHEITRTWDQSAATLQARATGTAKTVTVKRSKGKKRRTPGASRSLHPGDILACPRTGRYGVLPCPRGLEHETAGNLPGSGKSCGSIAGRIPRPPGAAVSQPGAGQAAARFPAPAGRATRSESLASSAALAIETGRTMSAA